MTTHAPTTQGPRTHARKATNNKQEQIASALRAALSLHTHSEGRWQKLIEQGATDEEISHHLVDEFGSGGSSQTEGGIQYAYKGLPETLFWLHASTHYTTMKPTLQGKSLIRRVRELLSIPQSSDVVYPRPETIIKQLDEAQDLNKLEQIISGYKLDDLEKSVYCAPANVEITREAIERARQRLAPIEEPPVADPEEEEKPTKFKPHEFKPTTSRDGRCSVCNKAGDATLHRAWKTEQREREQAGQPKQTAAGWREKAADALANVTRYRENPAAGKKLTAARERDWESKLSSATVHRRWGLTMEAIAAAVESGTLPPVLNGLTNQYQVRQLMDCVIEGRKVPAHGVPSTMGPTIKTAEEFAEAVRALSPLVPIVEPYTVEGELHGYGTVFSPDPHAGPAPEATEAADGRTDAVEDSASHAEVFYLIDVYEDSPPVITYLGTDTLLNLTADDDIAAIIGINAAGEKRILSKHKLPLTDDEIFAKYGADPRLIAPHAYNGRKAGDGSGENPCCVLSKDDSIHDITAASQTPSGGLQTQAQAVTDAAPLSAPYTTEVEVELNDHDIAAKARMASALAVEIAKLEAEKKDADAKFKKAIGGKEEERDKLLGEIGTGRAALELKVYDVPIYERRIVETRRYDNDEVVKTRDMKPREFEQRLFPN